MVVTNASSGSSSSLLTASIAVCCWSCCLSVLDSKLVSGICFSESLRIGEAFLLEMGDREDWQLVDGAEVGEREVEGNTKELLGAAETILGHTFKWSDSCWS